MQTAIQCEKTQQSIVGLWHNQHGTEVEFIVLDNGRITGSLTLREANGKRSQRYPVTGFAHADVVSFCGDFSKHDSMTAWVGQLTCAKNTFEAMWNMVVDVHGASEKAWKAVMTGNDVFTRGACPDELSPSEKPASHPQWCGLV